MLGALAQFTEEPCIVDCDDGLLDLTVVPAMDGPAYLDTFAQLLRDGAAGIQASLVTTRSAWIAYDSESEINVNLDGEPLVFKHNASTHQTPIARNIRRTKRLREISSSRRFSRSVRLPSNRVGNTALLERSAFVLVMAGIQFKRNMH